MLTEIDIDRRSVLRDRVGHNEKCRSGGGLANVFNVLGLPGLQSMIYIYICIEREGSEKKRKEILRVSDANTALHM